MGALAQDDSEACSAFTAGFASLVAPPLAQGEMELDCPPNSALATDGRVGCVCDDGFDAAFMAMNDQLTLVGSCDACAADDADCQIVSAVRRLSVAGASVEAALAQDDSEACSAFTAG